MKVSYSPLEAPDLTIPARLLVNIRGCGYGYPPPGSPPTGSTTPPSPATTAVRMFLSLLFWMCRYSLRGVSLMNRVIHFHGEFKKIQIKVKLNL